jgi:hypothetical protein
MGDGWVREIVSDASGRSARLEFTWRWKATPQVKASSSQAPSAGSEKGTALFQTYEDGWRLEQLLV